MLTSIKSLTRRQIALGILLIAVPSSAAVLPWNLTPVNTAQERPSNSKAEYALASTGVSPSTLSKTRSASAQTPQENGSSDSGSRQAGDFSSPDGAGELSLQETLDRLGYSVNVPTEYDGREVLNYNGYRTSTQDDSIAAETFTGQGTASFQLVSQQAYLATHTVFGLIDGNGKRLEVQQPIQKTCENWIGNKKSNPIKENVVGKVGFYIDSGKVGRSFGNSLYLSTSDQNPRNGRFAMILPVSVGGEWVIEAGSSGHWQGGTASGEYLVCWDDSDLDHDFQDMVIVVNGLTPSEQ